MGTSQVFLLVGKIQSVYADVNSGIPAKYNRGEAFERTYFKNCFRLLLFGESGESD